MVSGDVTTRTHHIVRAPVRGQRWVRSALVPFAASALAVAVVVSVWELVYLSGWKPPYVLPGPATVGSVLWHQLRDPLLWAAIRTTSTRALIGFALALVIGAAVGAMIPRNRWLRSALGPVITGLQTMPAIAWFPFAIIFFGLHTSAILFVIVIGAAPAIATGVIAGSDQIPPLLLRAAKTMGLKGFALYRHVVAPASLPLFVSGLRQGWAFAWRSLMAGELVVLVANTASIGVLLENAQNFSDMPAAIAIMVVILLIGIIVDAAFGAIDKRVRRRWGLIDAAAG